MARINQAVRVAAGATASLLLASPLLAQDKPSRPDRLEIKPILEARLRYETVDQGALDADAVTFRLRAGAEAKLGKFSFLAEGEGTLAPVNNYNAFPFPLADNQRRTQYAVVSDPENIELNRLQLQYKTKDLAFTLGRQRINLDDQRWVGAVGWRQNEQTFDAIRGEMKLGSVSADIAYAVNQRTIFGGDAGPRTGIEGKFLFAGIGAKLGPVQGKVFSYLIDYDETFALTNSSQTYGGYLSTEIPIGKAKVTARASYARQLDYGDNPFSYAADYWALEGGAKASGFTVSGGVELLGSDHGHSVQTPLATLHRFNGWADVFLTTPPLGLQDVYVSISKAFDGVRMLPGLNANIAFHQFDSDKGSVDYGTEWDASAGFKIGKAGILFKYADYDAQQFGVDTRKFWFQLEWSL
ncbi:alginate export family protein [Sphingomonas alba]|uniref:Alginate export family protein n=1 Tax=Sphingomonas alba TaxID=2908208 RepID=A0ABT0RN98_9SPHN|nr:alginate export family protein [Sphingomonas alba]MCL6684126.1 alginate export family protein [Sphingomonas alba]